VKPVKAVKFHYAPTLQTRELLETFRMMVNHAICICLEEKIKGRLKLRNRIYKEFQERYGVVSCYPYSVAEVAWSIAKKHRRWQRKPFASRLMMKMDSANYSLNYGILSLPFRKGERILLPLQYGDWQRSFLMDTTLNRGSITVTDSAIIITFSREIEYIKSLSRIGMDLNEKSAVLSDGTRFDLSDVARLHTEYGMRRSDFCQSHSGDRRLRRKFAGSGREKERVKQLLHRVSKEIVERAKEKKQALVLERLKGIRYAHKRGNGEGRGRRRRISLWPFRQLQGYIEYKATWEGVPIEYANASRTSQTCNVCGFINVKLRLMEREWQCPQCGYHLDRDLNAAINIEHRGKIPCLAVVRLGARGKDEAVKRKEQTTAPILRAEASKRSV
jgi:putative transposase